MLTILSGAQGSKGFDTDDTAHRACKAARYRLLVYVNMCCIYIHTHIIRPVDPHTQQAHFC